MKTTLAASAAALATLLTAAAAQEAGVFYLEAGVGVAAPSEEDVSFSDQTGSFASFEADLETGGQFHVLGGYELTPALAVELELRAHGHTDEFSSDDETTVVGAYMVNLVYRGSEAAAFVPYVGAGIGIAEIDFVDDGDVLEDEFDDAFAYQVKAGVAKPFGIHHSLALEAAYLDASPFEASSAVETVEFDYAGFSVGVNYRYRFGTR